MGEPILTRSNLIITGDGQIGIATYDEYCDPNYIGQTCNLCMFEGLGCMINRFVACGLVRMDLGNYISLGIYFTKAKSLYSRSLLKYDLYGRRLRDD